MTHSEMVSIKEQREKAAGLRNFKCNIFKTDFGFPKFLSENK